LKPKRSHKSGRHSSKSNGLKAFVAWMRPTYICTKHHFCSQVRNQNNGHPTCLQSEAFNQLANSASTKPKKSLEASGQRNAFILRSFEIIHYVSKRILVSQFGILATSRS
jgi:hypothetical protein